MRRWLAALVIAGLGLAGACDKSKKKAVPAEVEVEWPDAASFPGEDDPQPEPPVDAGEPAPEPSPGPAASMSTGSDG